VYLGPLSISSLQLHWVLCNAELTK